MEIVWFIVGALAGWVTAIVFDFLWYKQSPSFTKALDDAQNRIDQLQAEVAELRRERSERPEQPVETPLLYLEAKTDSSRAEADHARIEELERLMEDLRHESSEAERRARLFEARLTDASSELASLRYGLPTLDRKAEDELREMPRA